MEPHVAESGDGRGLEQGEIGAKSGVDSRMVAFLSGSQVALGNAPVPRSCASSEAGGRRSETSRTWHSQVELGNEGEDIAEKRS